MYIADSKAGSLIIASQEGNIIYELDGDSTGYIKDVALGADGTIVTSGFKTWRPGSNEKPIIIEGGLKMYSPFSTK